MRLGCSVAGVVTAVVLSVLVVMGLAVGAGLLMFAGAE